MRKLRALTVAGVVAVGMMVATPAPAGAPFCIDNPVICCGTVYVNGKPIQVIPISC